MKQVNRRIFTLGLALCAGLSFVPGSIAQQAPRVLSGRVVKGGQTVAGAAVTLHRVTGQASGPVATGTSDARGTFRFPLEAADTGFAVFFATVEHQSVRYFGPPVHRDQEPADYAVEVFDTTSVTPGALQHTRRDVVLIPQTDGGWEVNEVLRIRNPGRRTLVPGKEIATLELRLPEGATDFEAGEGDIPPEQVKAMGTRVFLLTSFTPGIRELFLRYRLPPGLSSAKLPVRAATDTINVYVRQPSPQVRVAGLKTTKTLEVQGEKFVQYGATDVAVGESVGLEWTGPSSGPVSPVAGGVAAALLLLGVGSWAAYRNRPDGPAAPHRRSA